MESVKPFEKLDLVLEQMPVFPRVQKADIPVIYPAGDVGGALGSSQGVKLEDQIIHITCLVSKAAGDDVGQDREYFFRSVHGQS